SHHPIARPVSTHSAIFAREGRSDSLLQHVIHDDANGGFDFPWGRLQLLSRIGEPRGDRSQDTPQVRFLWCERDVVCDPGGSLVGAHEPDGDDHNSVRTRDSIRIWRLMEKIVL